MNHRTAWMVLLIAMTGAGGARADEPAEPEPPVEEQTGVQPTAGEPVTTQPAATQPGTIMEGLLELRDESPLIDPVVEPKVRPHPAVRAPAVRVDLDRTILGVAPGQKAPPLLREGEIITARRGRIVQSGDGLRAMFIFEADSKDAPELPMILQECEMLESMEDIVQKRGDAVMFVVTGQVHRYHGANYLLPTMMKLEPNRGNLQQ